MSTESARAIEAILMVAQEPVETHLLAQLLEIAPALVDEICAQLQAEYVAQERGFVLVKVAGGYRFQSHADLAAYVERFALEGQSARLSSAALETLAIVAYKQPLSRAQIAAIRGVSVEGVMRTLQQRGYVEEIGRDSGPGQAALFGTSKEFLERMGLDRIEDLPAIADLFPSAEIMEALELTLRAERPEADQLPLDEAPVDAAAAPGDAPAAEAVAAEAGTDPTDDAALLAMGDDDFPEPELPAWAVDPPAEGPPADVDLTADLDVDADGQADRPAEP
ncbi:SMC-Scp complex subunit ScpB [Aquihabitans sp. McL0605]|uniref:SMC-Scp complex subunit ScpB n=1 Tax=Aquihabitans sp. McL0605 TaxID=3415671 RepID=UPI003CEE6E0A